MNNTLKIYTIILLSLFAFSYNAYGLDTNTLKIGSSTPSAVCSENGGSLSGTVSSRNDDFTYVSGFLYQFYETWFEQSTDYNKGKVPYLVQNNAINGSVTMIDNYTYNNDGTFTLSSKQFSCSCPNGIDTYGQCKEAVEETKNFADSDPTAICSQNGQVSGATGTLDVNDKVIHQINGGQSSIKIHGRTYVRNSENDTVVKYLVKNSDDGTNSALYIYDWNHWGEKTIGWTQKASLWFNNITCSCPEGAVGNQYGQCEPLNCQAPEIEISPGICGTPDFCPDGGYKSSGSCDRTCEDIGMITQNIGTPDILNPNASKMCVTSLDCNSIQSECIAKCGSSDNIDLTSSFCNSSLNTSACKCKDDNLDDNIPDPEDIDENSTDNEIQNSLLKSIKDENQKQTSLLEDYEGLLTANNESNLRQEDSLGSIDGKLSNIDGSINNLSNDINNVGDSVDSMKEVLNADLEQLKSGQDEGNGLLNDIKTNTRDNADSNQSIFDKISEFFDLMTDVDGISNKISSIDMEGKTQGYLDSAFSQFGNVLGISQSYGVAPSNVSVELFNKTYTLIDFSVLNPYIGVIRNLFLSMAYIVGFLILLRKS